MSETNNNNEVEAPTQTTSERQVRSAARLQREAKKLGIRSSTKARKIMMEAVKEHNYSLEDMDKLWQQAIGIAQDSKKKTVQEKDVLRVLSIVQAMK
jgi:histone H3/H4